MRVSSPVHDGGRASPFRVFEGSSFTFQYCRLASLCSILNKIWDLAPPLLIGVAVDVVVEEDSSCSWGLVDPWHQLIALSIATFGIWGLNRRLNTRGILWRNLVTLFT